MATLVLFVGAVVALSSPASALVDKTMEVTYTCQGTTFTPAELKVTITAPESAALSGTAAVKWKLPQLTASKALAGTLKIDGSLAVAGGSAATLSATQSPTVTVAASGTYTPPEMTGTLTAPATAGTLTLTPVPTTPSLTLAYTPTAGGTTPETTNCTFKTGGATPASLAIEVKQGGGGGGTGTDILAYTCSLGVTDTDPATVDIKVVLTVPTSAKANEDASITWTSTIQTTGDPLKAPAAGLPTGSKLFATLKASGAGAPATATGEVAMPATTAGQDITTLPAVTVKLRPTTTGSVTITPGDLAFGTSATAAALTCKAPTTGLKTYTLTVGNGSPSPSPSPSQTPSPSESNSPKPTKTTTVTVTETPADETPTRSSKTPKAGADTGAGGETGPDGRLFVLTGSMLIVAAGAGGLMMRRRTIGKG
ncbi:hypothetical protein [Nonomuraea cavernae]|nr:hypothetical protein [Nonomuraea cavernae]MCA2187247.1 hypothetical protein [Nonomuraea cavernae]